MTKLRPTLFILATVTFALPSIALADWPERPVHFIVPFPAGGASDTATRLVTNYVSGTLGRRIVVENRSGANGNIGNRPLGLHAAAAQQGGSAAQ